MARRKRGHKPNPIRRIVKQVASGVATILKAGPAIFPAVKGVQAVLAGERNGATFVYEASGYNLNSNQLDEGKLQEVIMRDIALVGMGMFVAWASKRA